MKQDKLRMSSVMTPSPYTIGVDQPLLKARELMLEHSIRHLPVLQGGQLVGVISDRDIDFALRVEKKGARDLTIEDAYTADVYTVNPHKNLKEVAAHMADQRIGCAVVMQHGKAVGIFTTVDACRVLSEVL